MAVQFRREIRKLLARKRVNIYTTARLAGLRSPATLYNYLNGKTEMTTTNLEKVLSVLQRMDKPD